MTPSTTQPERMTAPGEPAFIRRLPEGVEYTHIKTIFMNLPSSLTTLLWATHEPGDHLIGAFKARTVRAIDRALRREQKSSTNREHLTFLRHELVQLCLQELTISSPHPERSISITTVFPQLFDEEHRPPGPSVPYVRITVTQAEMRRAPRKRTVTARKVLTERIIVSEPATWNASIPWIDTERVDLTILDLLRTHFPGLMSVRVGARWRSDYSSEGWRLVTQYAVPQLYDYVRPFYEVRRYRTARQKDGPAHYPAKLRRDITDIIRFELRHLAGELTVARVTAAIQRHIARTHDRRGPSTRKRAKQ